MSMPELQIGDVIVVDGLWYMPHHWLIRWRGLDRGVHCCTVLNPDTGMVVSPEFAGIKFLHLNHYAGRRITIHRFNEEFNKVKAQWWMFGVIANATGYDFRQWLMGFVLGMTTRAAVDNSRQWTCAELPYWLYQENGCAITPTDEVLPMPRLFRYNPKFTVVFDGVIP